MHTNVSTARSIFLAAVENYGADEWSAYLDDVCGNDAALRGEVERLLTAHRKLGTFHDHAAAHVTASLAAIDGDGPGVRIGPYVIREQLGEGGMGVVYVAEQMEPVRRKVALKIIKPGMASKQVIARFEAERQALALMSHPNIAKVLDGGTTDRGRPYFVMDLVKGLPITKFCDKHAYDVSQRLKLFVNVCQAVQHAHMKGVIHRDLKPSNILVELHDVVAVPKVIDFGIAKATNQQLTQETVYTQYAQLVGTPLYMSPEQAELSGLDIDTRSDVYSLGVMLYELLTGLTPFDKSTLRRVGLDEMRRIIREQEPLRPSEKVSTVSADQVSTISQSRKTDPRQLSLAIRGELDWIVMRALEKDRNRRYESASGLAADIQRYLAGEPVEACPPSVIYRARKFVSRYRELVISASLLLITAFLGALVSLYYARQAESAAQTALRATLAAEENLFQAVSAKNESNIRLYAAEMKLASDAINVGDARRASEILERYASGSELANLRGAEWFFYRGLITQQAEAEITLASIPECATISPDKQQVAVATEGGGVHVFDLQPWALRLSAPFHGIRVRRLAWSPDGHSLATACEDGIVRIWDLDALQIAREFNAQHGRMNDIQFSSDGQRLFTCGDDGTAKSWVSRSGELLREFSGHEREVERLDLSGDDQLLTTASSDRTCAVWNVESGERIYDFSTDQSGGRAVSVAISDDGRRVAVGNIYGDIYLSDVTKSNAVLLGKLNDGIEDMRFLGEGQLLATADRGGTISIHKIPDASALSPDSKLETLLAWTAHAGRINFLSQSGTGTSLISGGDDGSIRMWTPQVEGFRWPLFEKQVYCDLDVLSNAKVVACEMAIEVWDVATRQRLSSFARADSVWKQVASSADGRWLAAARDGQLARFDLQTQKMCETWDIEEFVSPPKMAISGDGRRIAVLVASDQELVRVFSAAQSAPEFSFPVQQCRCLAFSPDGRWLAAGSMDDLHLYDLTSGTMKFLRGHTSTLAAAAFSPDGAQVATVSHDRRLKLWDLPTGAELRTVVAHADFIKSVAYIGDGKTLATGGDDGQVKFWHATSGQPLGSLTAETMDVHKIRLSPDGRVLAALLDFHKVIVYDAQLHASPRVSPSPNPLPKDTQEKTAGR